MKTLWCKNQENPSDRISHAWAPLNIDLVRMHTEHRSFILNISLNVQIQKKNNAKYKYCNKLLHSNILFYLCFVIYY